MAAVKLQQVRKAFGKNQVVKGVDPVPKDSLAIERLDPTSFKCISFQNVSQAEKRRTV